MVPENERKLNVIVAIMIAMLANNLTDRPLTIKNLRTGFITRKNMQRNLRKLGSYKISYKRPSFVVRI